MMTDKGEVWEVTIAAIDALNPGVGHQVRVSRNGHRVYASAVHPVTGEPMGYHDCLGVAVMYGPKVVQS